MFVQDYFQEITALIKDIVRHIEQRIIFLFFSYTLFFVLIKTRANLVSVLELELIL